MSGLSASPREDLSGQTAGEYQLLRRLGSGAMGVVYEGLQPAIGKRVAVKVLRPHAAADPELLARFFAEARTANSIRHRGIVDIFAFGQLASGAHYHVMELLEGEPFDRVIRERAPLPVDEVLHYVDQVLDTLDAAHDAGVIHRDLKPSNLFLVTPPHDSPYVKLLDFGIAKLTEGAPLTRAGDILGTPGYVSPEQARGAALSPASDLYSLGCVAFELLTGRAVFVAPTPASLLVKHVSEAAPLVSSLVPEVPPEIDELVAWLLAKEPGDRPATARELREHLSTLTSPSPDEAEPAAASLSDDPLAAGPTVADGPLPTDEATRIEPWPKRPEPRPTGDDLQPLDITLPRYPNPLVRSAEPEPSETDPEGQALSDGPAISDRPRPRMLLAAIGIAAVVAAATAAVVVALAGPHEARGVREFEEAKRQSAAAAKARADLEARLEAAANEHAAAPSNDSATDTPSGEVPVAGEAAAAKTDSAKTDSAKTDSAKTDSAKTDSAKTDSAKTDSAKTDSAKTDSAKTDSAKTESAKTDPAKTDPTKTELAKADSAKIDPDESDDSEAAKGVAASADDPKTAVADRPRTPKTAKGSASRPRTSGISEASLEARLKRVRAKVAAIDAQAGAPDPVLHQFLSQAEADVANAQTDAQRRAAWHFLSEFEQQADSR